MGIAGQAVDDRDHFVVRINSRDWQSAQVALTVRGIGSYLPTSYSSGRLPREMLDAGVPRPDVARPIFPGVLFVEAMTAMRAGQLIRSVPGVMADPFMRFGESVARVRPLAMAAVRRIEAEERATYFSKKHAFSKPAWLPEIGDEVRILLNASLGGLRGKVESIDKSGRINLLVDLMKRATRATVVASQIEPA